MTSTSTTFRNDIYVLEQLMNKEDLLKLVQKDCINWRLTALEDFIQSIILPEITTELTRFETRLMPFSITEKHYLKNRVNFENCQICKDYIFRKITTRYFTGSPSEF